MPEVPDWQDDGKGARGVRRLSGRPTTLTRELSAQIVALVGEVGAATFTMRAQSLLRYVEREGRHVTVRCR